MGVEKQESCQRNLWQLKLDYEHEQEPFGNVSSDFNIFFVGFIDKQSKIKSILIEWWQPVMGYQTLNVELAH